MFSDDTKLPFAAKRIKTFWFCGLSKSGVSGNAKSPNARCTVSLLTELIAVPQSVRVGPFVLFRQIPPFGRMSICCYSNNSIANIVRQYWTCYRISDDRRSIASTRSREATVASPSQSDDLRRIFNSLAGSLTGFPFVANGQQSSVHWHHRMVRGGDCDGGGCAPTNGVGLERVEWLRDEAAMIWRTNTLKYE